MRGVAKRQCDRILATLRGCCCARALTLGARQLLANLNLTTAAAKLGPELRASPRSLLGLSADGYYSLPELLPPTGAAATALAHRRTRRVAAPCTEAGALCVLISGSSP